MNEIYVMCVDNSYYQVSLTKHKVYKVIPDPKGEELGMIRLVDDTGEDYLFSTSIFVPVTIPQEAEASFEAVKA